MTLTKNSTETKNIGNVACNFILSIAIFLFFIFCFPLFGQVRIVDGDTIHLNGEKIRLDGVDAPETDQICTYGNTKYFCGQEATLQLKKIVEKGTLYCEGASKDRYGRIIGTCFVNGENVNRLLVMSGWALAYRQYSKKYVEEEAYAKRNDLGMWRGDFIAPWNWRKGVKLVGKKDTDQACNIKGNISSSGEKIYHVLGGAYYSRTKITESKGERFFCTEDEALKYGWRKSKR